MMQVIQDYENTQSALVVQMFFWISLNPLHWVTNETRRGWNIMLEGGLEVYRRKCAISYYVCSILLKCGYGTM